jgi:enolase
VFPVADNNEGLVRIKKCAEQLKLGVKDYAIGTDNAFSEIQKGDLAGTDKYRMRFSQGEDSATITREQLVDFCGKIVESAPNFVTMEDPASEHDPIGHKLMSAKYGKRVQIVIDDLAVTQMRYILPFLASKEMNDRCGSSVLIKLNQAGTFTETCLAIEIVLGIANVAVVEDYLAVRGDLKGVISDLKKVGVASVAEAVANIKENKFTAFFSHRSTEGSSEFLPYLPLMYGAVSPKVWFKAGAPNGERNLQNYNPLIRAEEEMLEAGINVQVTAWNGLPGVVTEIPALLKK